MHAPTSKEGLEKKKKFLNCHYLELSSSFRTTKVYRSATYSWNFVNGLRETAHASAFNLIQFKAIMLLKEKSDW